MSVTQEDKFAGEEPMGPESAVAAFLLACGVRNMAMARIHVLEQLQHDLQEANAHLNLTRLAAPADFWTKHVADSLAVGQCWPQLLNACLRVADVGCGGGFPMLPLAWANPELKLTGIECRVKKADFVREESLRLGLENCDVVARQAREAARLPQHAAQYDVVLLRAVGTPENFVRECRLLLKPAAGARIVFYMTPQSISDCRPAAAREAEKYKFTLAESAPIELPLGAGPRQFLSLIRR